ncbi:DegV family protein [Clostridium sp. JN-9]|uniref:DegV family protein n=1 Tax=Clostridium sp. JN-9 TaxID=2507159 RepID=UPI000FFDF9D0|nr:DegV family protein [Clostridium sp. JN-9]QAT40431.1 DegV family protein [Clostridium sp. JN-9]
MAVEVLTDSTSYINKDIIEKLNINIVSLSVRFDDVSFKETEIDNESFYKMMDEKGIPISSQPSAGEMYVEMEKVVKRGNSLLAVFISSEMSGTCQTAHMARKMILEKYKDAEIEIVDSRSNSMQLGFAVISAAKAAKDGKSLLEVKEAAESNLKKSRFLFIPKNLVYLKKGGRIGGANALIGNLLKIIPILTVENGNASVFTKVRTKQRAIKTMAQKMFQDINDFGLGEIVIHNINCYDEAKELAEYIMEKLKVNINICDIGPVIGLHVGPGAIGIVYYTKEDLR